MPLQRKREGEQTRRKEGKEKYGRGIKSPHVVLSHSNSTAQHRAGTCSVRGQRPGHFLIPQECVFGERYLGGWRPSSTSGEGLPFPSGLTRHQAGVSCQEEAAKAVIRSVGSSQTALGPQATTPLKSCVSWGKLFNLNNPQFLLYSGNKNVIYLVLHRGVMKIP